MSNMQKLSYETKLFRILRNLEEDFANNRISEKEFEILIGFLIEKEFSDNLKHQMSHILPKPKRKNRGFSWVNYEWKQTNAR